MLWLTAGLIAPAHAEPLRIAHTIWVGYGPLLIAQERGFFAREGVEVELIRIEEHTTTYAGLFSGQIDAVAAAFQDAPAFSDPEEPDLVCVLILDDSRGADGVLATKEIRSIPDLKGRSVAVLHGSVSQFYLNVLLQDAGLRQADIELVDISAEDAGEAFLLQEVDAAVTWEPWLTRGKAAAHGHLLTDTSERPGLIVDGLLTRADVFAERKDDFRAFASAWDAAVGYYQAHPDEAISIMARHVGGWLEDPAVFAETLKGVRFYDAKSNRAYFGTPDRPGQIYQTAQYAIDVWGSVGMLKLELSPADIIAHGIWGE
ncbi:MAG TPA: ABC transporter substrate-binding protein [Geminicoccaceae bacterium]|nr:ABC transporter substrate-binding protein [Geminicoccaceae bacterium]